VQHIEIHFAVEIGVVEYTDGVGSGWDAREIAHTHVIMFDALPMAKYFALVAREAVGSVVESTFDEPFVVTQTLHHHLNTAV
jgi:hypothetical protein